MLPIPPESSPLLNYAPAAHAASHAVTFRRVLLFTAAFGLLAGLAQAVRTWPRLAFPPLGDYPGKLAQLHDWWTLLDSALLQVVSLIALGLLALRAYFAGRRSAMPLLVVSWIVLVLTLVTLIESNVAAILLASPDRYVPNIRAGFVTNFEYSALTLLPPGLAAAAVLLLSAVSRRPHFPPRRLTLIAAVATFVLYAGFTAILLIYFRDILDFFRHTVLTSPLPAWSSGSYVYVFLGALVFYAVTGLLISAAILALIFDRAGRRLLIALACTLILVHACTAAQVTAFRFLGNARLPPGLWPATTSLADTLCTLLRAISPPALIALLAARPRGDLRRSA